MDPTKEESNRKEVSEFLVFVDKKLGATTPKKILDASQDSYGNGVELNDVVALLCTILSNLSPEQQEFIIYDARDKTSRRLADWWEEHQEADRKRLKKELKAVKDEEDRKVALDKLTPHERKLLGLN
jgi:hypothetical protein